MAFKTPTSTPVSKVESRIPATTPGVPKAKEEKIFVTVRLRPLSKKEIVAKDQVAWECVDEHTIKFNPATQDRPMLQDRLTLPACYSFDKVFGPPCATKLVYQDGAKDVALSSLTGINATIFAYGQTSSGKTFTMRGITECAVNDIYRHIDDTRERNFTIKMSALEIYNEVVKDLLNPDSGPLRLLDDPEKGTIVEKLMEETASDSQHLRRLISICEAQRQVGETALNDTSSRSHQIIRLTIESSLRENSGCVKSFVATLNFVDLAGSERISQTHADGARLKEGCHINRSLLTLTTVIRKLSFGKKSGHIPYRDSKLTRILQLSLGGNARTAIICTMSPALSHVEQSRNTLSFATRAKEVTNTAQVNIVTSDKQLVKQLQREVARLEAELRTPEPSSAGLETLLLEKDMTIEKMKIRLEQVLAERDEVLAERDELRRKVNEEPPNSIMLKTPNKVAKCLTFSGLASPVRELEKLNRGDKLRSTTGRPNVRQSSTTPFVLINEIRKLEQLQNQLGEEANRALELLQKEVACHRLGNQNAAETIAKLQAEIKEMSAVKPVSRKTVDAGEEGVPERTVGANLKEEITRLHSQGTSIANLEEQLENVQRSIDKLVQSLPSSLQLQDAAAKSSKGKSKKKKTLPLSLSNNINRPSLIKSPCPPLSASRMVKDSETENRAPEADEVACNRTLGVSSETATPTKSEDGDVSSREGTPCYGRSSSVNMRKMEKMFKNAAEENVRSIKDYVTGLKERVAKLQYQKQLLVCQVLELEANEAAGQASDDDGSEHEIARSPSAWLAVYREQRQQIILLWDICHVSIIHRTQFNLILTGDAADQIYMEVELRRLNWLQQHLAENVNASPSPARTEDEPVVSLSSSIRTLKSEREFLAKRLNSRLSLEERQRLYMRWDVPMEGKHRRIQLVNKLWTDPHDEIHIQESAETVAKLVGFCEGKKASREMFALNFAVPSDKKPWLLGWTPISNLLHL